MERKHKTLTKDDIIGLMMAGNRLRWIPARMIFPRSHRHERIIAIGNSVLSNETETLVCEMERDGLISGFEDHTTGCCDYELADDRDDKTIE